MIRYNEPLQVHPIEVLPHIHPLAYQLHNVLLADMDKTSDQQKIQAKAHHLIIQHKEDNHGSRLQINMVSDPPPISLAGEQIRIPLLTDMGNTNVQPEIRAKAHHLFILHKEDNQGNHLQINMVSVLRQINQIRRTGGSNHIHPLATPMIDTDNTNDLCKKEIKDRQHSNLLIRPTEMHPHIPPLVDPLSNVPLTDRGNTGSRRRNQDQDRRLNQTKAPFLILIQKMYRRNIPLSLVKNIRLIKNNIANSL